MEGQVMTVDQELERHRRTWHGFIKLLAAATGAAAIVLIGMAIFLL